MERKVVFFAYLGPGATSAEGFIVPDGWTSDMLDDAAREFGVTFAESYGVYQPDPDNEEDDEEGLHGYSWDNVEGYWKEYNAEKHDGLIMYGNQKESHWNQL